MIPDCFLAAPSLPIRAARWLELATPAARLFGLHSAQRAFREDFLPRRRWVSTCPESSARHVTRRGTFVFPGRAGRGAVPLSDLMETLSVQQLIDAGVHFGCRVSRWNPKMAPYIHGRRNLIHVIELREKSRQIAKIGESLEGVARRGIPSWLELEKEQFRGRVSSLPNREDLTMPMKEQLIVELYSK